MASTNVDICSLPLNTVDDACELLSLLERLRSQGEPIPPIGHIFFAKVDDGLNYEPYTIRAVSRDERPTNYYIVKRSCIVHVNRTKSVYKVLGSVSEWRREAAQYSKIRRLDFFKMYLKRKALFRWVDEVREMKLKKSRVLLGKQLLLAQPRFSGVISSLMESMFEMQWRSQRGQEKHAQESLRISRVRSICMSADSQSEDGYSPQQFSSGHNEHSNELKRYMADVLVRVLSEVVKKASSAQKDLAMLAPAKEPKEILGAVNKEVAAQRQREEEREKKKVLVDYEQIGSLVRTAHHMQVEALFLQACSTLFELNALVQSKELPKSSLWLFRVECVVDGDQVSLLPSKESVMDLAKSVLSGALRSLANIPTCASSSEFSEALNPTELASLRQMFAGDAFLSETVNAIVGKIEDDYDDAIRKLSIYEPFLNAFTFTLEWANVYAKWSGILSSKDSLVGAIEESEMRPYITKAVKLQTDVKRLAGRVFGTVVVTCDNTINKFATQLNNIVKQIKESLQTLIESQYVTLKDEASEWMEKLKPPELSLEPYVNWLLDVRAGEEAFESFVDQVSDLQNLYYLRSELQEKLKAEEVGEDLNLGVALRDPFVSLLTAAKSHHESNFEAMQESVKMEHEKIILSLQEVEKRLDSTYGSLKTNEGGTSALSKLEKVQEFLSRRRQDAHRLDGYIDILEMEPLNWTEIGVADDELKKFQDLWTIYEEAEKLKATLLREPVQNLDGQDLKDTIISLFQRSFKLSKVISGDVTESLVAFLGAEKMQLPMYVELSNKALKEENWNEIFRVTKVEPIPPSLRTLRAVAAAGLLEGHEEKITHVVSNAVGLYELEQHIAKIESYWASCEFVVTPYAGRANAFVIDGADDILTELEEQQVVVQTCLASKYLPKVQGAVEEWESKLAMIRAVIIEWVAVQKSWMYLEFIFSSDDIKRQLPDESLLFSSADRFFSALMKRSSSDAHVAPLCLGGDTLKKLQKCTYQLDCIQRKLDEYLETKRVAFPRFYFLSNDELLSILSDSRNPLAVQPHLQKCFDNIKELIFADAKTIISMKSSEGEVVPFSTSVKVLGSVESWLNDVEHAMRETLHDALRLCVEDYTVEGRSVWFFNHPAQCVSTADQIVWTGDVERVISEAAHNAAAWPGYLQWFHDQLLCTVGLVEQNLTSLQRTIVSNLIVVDVHCRDVCNQLAEAQCISVVDFDWQKQLRFYWTEPLPEGMVKDCIIRHGAAQLSYGYEYLGNQPRLVITPLTERAFLTCTAALHMQKGAAPQGPAGTGKTESVKDLGKALARQVVVFNCSDGLNYKMMSQMFAGLAQGGAWACFDEFNRIELEVLSVIAQQMLDITTAIASKQVSMSFEGHRIKLNPNFGVFITMNPGYAGRTELPDNLKALFRPICMMIPNYALIAEIMFYSEGYTSAGNLAKKMIRLYSLASQQLSKQDHYDFGMRAVKSILVLAGRLKRAEPDANEEILLVKAIRDANLPKFLTDDTQLFLALLQDFFPDVTEVKVGAVSLVIEEKARKVLGERQLQATNGMILKVQQLFDTLTTRHGLMLVGQTMTGKSTVMETLAETLTCLEKDKSALEHMGTRYLSFFTTTLRSTSNPKSITMTELYGDVNPLTREWQDGVFSFIVRELVKEASTGASARRHWVVFDGPVDALWIENLNTVLDDSKMLCLVNGERIRIPESISLLFEVQDLRVASPATVSRCGMVYVEEETLDDGWSPVVCSLSAQAAKDLGIHWRHDRFLELCALMVPRLLACVRSKCREYIPTVNAQLACSLFYLLKAAVMEMSANATEDAEKQVKKGQRGSQVTSQAARRASAVLLGVSFFDALFIQACVWGIGGNLADGFREQFAAEALSIVREAKLHFPTEAEGIQRGVFDYTMDTRTGHWCLWSDLIPKFRYDASLPFFDLVVPTEHTVILNYLLSMGKTVRHHMLFNGRTGTAKSSTVNNFLVATLRTEDAGSAYSSFSYTLSAQTSSSNLQETIESKLTKRKGDKELGPSLDKQLMIAVIDDCNVPMLEEYGAAPPIELLRQMITQGGFYDRKKLFFKEVENVMLIGCCGEPGGGANELTPRFTSKLLTFCVPELSQASMRTIFLTILSSFFEARSFSEAVTQLAGAVVDCTLEAYRRIAVECLPTPEKTHCTFNLRDVSKVIQGILQVKSSYCDAKERLIFLWSHEASRVFHDRLVDDEDRDWWWRCSSEIVRKHFDTEEITEEHLRGVLYGNWGNTTNRDYQQIELGPHTQEVVAQYLAEYNVQSSTAMHLVLFTEAVHHLSRICRIINQPRGHALLVGVGGSGRSSLCRLAAFMMNMDLQTVNIVRGYGTEEFRDDMRKALLDGGARGKEVVFQLSDPQIVRSQMLEDINNVLNIGEVPGMMRLEDIEVILRFCREPCLTAGRPDTRSSIYQYFVSRCRERVHVVLCMSPMSGCFRDRLRMFPALVNCTTIDWFTQWPSDALLAVARAVLREKKNPAPATETTSDAVGPMMVYVHSTVKEASVELFEQVRRRNHTTPTSYLAALSLYQVMLKDLESKIDFDSKRYANGLQKLNDANRTIAVLKKQISDMQPALTAAAAQVDEQRRHVLEEQREADAIKVAQSKEEATAQALMREAETIRKECEEGLQEAMPALEAAERALETLSPKDIQEIKTFMTPPSNVEKTMNAVLILLKEKEGWANAKSCLSRMDFVTRLTAYPRDEMSAALIRKLAVYANDPEFVPEIIEKTSLPCRSMCMWVHAMYKYYFVAKEVAPKRERLRISEAKVASTRADLQATQVALQRVMDRIAALEATARAAQDEADRLHREMETACARLSRADQLTHGLASERVRWTASWRALEGQRTRVMGTALLGASCVTYLGPFPATFRERLLAAWKAECQALSISFDDDFALERMMPEAVVQQWSLQSLPRDTFSIQNATILQRSARWCYMIDPQGQANAFLRKKEAGTGHGLLVLKLTDDNFMRSIENAVQVGQSVLLEGVGETLEAALDPILLRQVRRTGGRNVVVLGDKEVPYDDRFRLYITTKLSNPVLTPELQVKVTVLNFTVTREGLEEQLLSDIVGTERAALQRDSDRCIVSIAANRDAIRALEEQVLRMLNEATGDVLDNVELIDALQTSKATFETITQELAVVEETNAKIALSREWYRPLATRGSLIYSVIADLAKVDSMYEYSLQFFKGLVVSVLKAARRRTSCFERGSEDGPPTHLKEDGGAGGSTVAPSPRGSFVLEETSSILEDDGNGVEQTEEEVTAHVVLLTEEVTWTSYRVICRGLFERHKLLFSLLLATTVMKSTGGVTEEEWTLFLRGGVGRHLPPPFDDESRRPSYMSTVAWTDWGALCGLKVFEGVCHDFFRSKEDWQRWFVHTYGEEVLPKRPEPLRELSLWHQTMFLRAVRPEALHAMVVLLVQSHLAQRYTRAPAFSVSEAFRDSTKLTPIIFILSPGADPTTLFCSFAEEMGYAERKHMLSLGQDQGPRAQKMVEDGRRDGSWVYLQNCHVYASWMPQLQQLVEAIHPTETHDDFRLWLTSSPSPTFPVAVLQAGMKLTREPPFGLKGKVRDTLSTAQVVEAWDEVPRATRTDASPSASLSGSTTSRGGRGTPSPSSVTQTPDWRRLVVALAMFHGVILERRQFGPLGWNMPYEWGGADFEAGLCTLTTALARGAGAAAAMPWEELTFMLGTIDYGGRVTDLWDTRCLEVIAQQFFSEAGARGREGEKANRLGGLPALPEGCSYEELLQWVEREVADRVRPEGLGLHMNASISVDRKHSAALIEALVNINTGGSMAAALDSSEEGPVGQIATNLLRQLPPLLPRCDAAAATGATPLGTLLSHEVDLYNRLAREMRATLVELLRALKGEVVMTARMEQVAARLGYNQIPDPWRTVGYLSLKPLGSYFEDYLRRMAFIDRWQREGPPPSFWLPGLFFPQGFVTAVLQARSRALHVPIDSLHYRFRALTPEEGQRVMEVPTAGLVGVYVHGLYLEGCGWDAAGGHLQESRPGEVTTPMPVLHFEPVTADVRDHYETTYECPLYKVSSRAGTLSTTGVSTNYIATLALPSLHGTSGDHWILRGVAGLCALDV